MANSKIGEKNMRVWQVVRINRKSREKRKIKKIRRDDLQGPATQLHSVRS